MTSKPPTEIQALIETLIKGFNEQNVDLFSSVFGEETIIIDGIAPFRWLYPNAPAKWLADVDKWRKEFEVTHEQLSYEMTFSNVDGSHAYAVTACSLEVTSKGQTAARTGTLAFTFAKNDGEWKIESQAWGRTS